MATLTLTVVKSSRTTRRDWRSLQEQIGFLHIRDDRQRIVIEFPDYDEGPVRQLIRDHRCKVERS